ncbi:MAG: 50S ribosomal protein L6 [Kiritimatiellae bacterium]|nr:50S ribosomal protein L6 [Kiritimatiellia bacterium]MDD5522243.1 50S ribosomal protein L6 [Kiritimatiellia bacterium]
MSRVGQKPVEIPSGVTVTVNGSDVRVKGAKAELTMAMPSGVSATVEGAKVIVKIDDIEKGNLHGLTRTLIANMIEGVTKGYSKELEIQGVGFKAALQGQKLQMSLGFPKPVEYTVPDGIKIVVTEGTAIVVSGADKQQVGDVSARIRSYFPAEPYKGKGIRFKGEYVRRKVGKTVA